MIDKKWNIVDRLGFKTDYCIEKPKWMHWKAFNRLEKEVNQSDGFVMSCIEAKFGFLRVNL